MNKTITICPKRRLMTGIKYSILPIFLFLVLLSSDSLAQPPCGKFYLVIDGGDSKGPDAPMAEHMAKDADSIALWLLDNGFKGKRLSQYGGSKHPSIRDKDHFGQIILSYKDKLKCPLGSQCCHELFIYINSHGAQTLIELWDKTGSKADIIFYDDLVKWLNQLPSCVKLTIFIDACKSGSAIDDLMSLCERFEGCGVTIMTATDKDSDAPSGAGLSDSATEDFMEGAGADHDGDGDKGDIRDRWLEMKNEWGGENPQLDTCKGQKRMCSLENIYTPPSRPQGILRPWPVIPETPPIPEPLVAIVHVHEEEMAYLSRQIGGQTVATVLVNDEPRELPEPDEGIPVNPGDVIQLIGTVGSILGHFTFTPEEDIAPPPGAPPVVECPKGQPAVISVPGTYTGTPIEDVVVTTAPVETAVTTGKVVPEEKPPAVVTPSLSKLEPVLKTDDTLVAAGNLKDPAMGSNKVTVANKNTGTVLGQTQVDTWRLAGASLNPPVIDKGGKTNLRLDVFGPPDLQLEVTATAGEGLTPKQLTATAPISVLQKEGLGAFTATKAGTHNVRVKALPIIYEGKEPVMGLPAWR